MGYKLFNFLGQRFQAEGFLDETTTTVFQIRSSLFSRAFWCPHPTQAFRRPPAESGLYGLMVRRTISSLSPLDR